MPAPPFRIKICGITRAEDLRIAVESGADAIGLNFYPESSRYLNEESRYLLRISLREQDKLEFVLNRKILQVVGVFVNETLDSTLGTTAELCLSGVQLHGDESPESLATYPQELPLIRARRMDDRGVAAIAEDLEACRAAGRVPDAVLVDALTPGRYGGTGETVSWAGLADHPKWLGEVPLILAGGLTPENVAEAIRIVRPAGVDVASGVESSPGVKDHEKVKRFVEAAKNALDNL